LAFTPYPAEVVASGRARFDLPALADAVGREKQLFRQIASGWSAALPNSASAKEAVAVSLEMLGDSTALDTLMAARRLTDEPQYQLELAVEEALLRFEFAHESVPALQILKRLADSLLAGVKDYSGGASILAPIAVLRGRCSTAAKLRSTPDPLVIAKSSAHIKASASELTIRVAMGCAPDYLRESGALVESARRDRPGMTPEDLAEEEYALLSQAVPFVVPFDTARLIRHDRTPDYLWAAQRALIVGDTRQARATLERLAQRRGPVRAREVSPDALLAEARLWVALGDSARARAWLDPVLNRTGWLDFLVEDPVNTASLIQCMALRSELATPSEFETRRKWSSIVSTLWADAEPGPRELSRRLAAATLRSR
jgi:hypothetical protein